MQSASIWLKPGPCQLLIACKIYAVAFSPDGTKAVTASKDKTWAVWTLDVRYGQDEDPKACSYTTTCCLMFDNK